MSVTELEFDAHRAEEAQNSGGPVQGRTQWQLTWMRLRSDKVSMIALAVILIMVLLAIFAPAIAALTHHPVDMAYPVNGENEDGNPVGPGVNGFILGTDSTGRDLLVRVLYGARISLFVGVVTTLIATVLGVAVGLIAGTSAGSSTPCSPGSPTPFSPSPTSSWRWRWRRCSGPA